MCMEYLRDARVRKLHEKSFVWQNAVGSSEIVPRSNAHIQMGSRIHSLHRVLLARSAAKEHWIHAVASEFLKQHLN